MPSPNPFVLAQRLRPGTALVLTGPEGCGKSTQARAVLDAYGKPWAEVTAQHLLQPFGAGPMLEGKGGLLVEDNGLRWGRHSLSGLLVFATLDDWHLYSRTLRLGSIPAPRMVICTTSDRLVRFASDHPAAFDVVTLPDPWGTTKIPA